MSNSQLDSSTWMSHRLLCKNGHITIFLNLKLASPLILLTFLPVSVNKYLVKTYYVPGIVLGTWDA